MTLHFSTFNVLPSEILPYVEDVSYIRGITPWTGNDNTGIDNGVVILPDPASSSSLEPIILLLTAWLVCSLIAYFRLKKKEDFSVVNPLDNLKVIVGGPFYVSVLVSIEFKKVALKISAFLKRMRRKHFPTKEELEIDWDEIQNQLEIEQRDVEALLAADEELLWKSLEFARKAKIRI